MSKKRKDKNEELFEPIVEFEPATADDYDYNSAPADEPIATDTIVVEEPIVVEEEIIIEEAAPAEEEAEDAEEAEEVVIQPAMLKKYKNAVYRPMNCAQPVITPVNPIQLQPIVVPVAIVPYATQNQPVLQYGDEGAVYEAPQTTYYEQAAPVQQQYYQQPAAPAPAPVAPAPVVYAEPAPAPQIVTATRTEEHNYMVKPEKIKSKALTMMILAILFLVPFLLGIFNVSIGTIEFSALDIFDGIFNKIFGDATDTIAALGEYWNMVVLALAFVAAVALFVMSLICLIINRSANYILPSFIIFFLMLGGFVGSWIAVDGFYSDLGNQNIGWLILMIIAIVIGVVSIIFASTRAKIKELTDEELADIDPDLVEQF